MMSDLALPFDRTWKKPPEPDPDALDANEGGEVVVLQEGPDGVRFDPQANALLIDDDEGGTIVRFNPPRDDEPKDERHFDNLADKIPDFERGRIVDEVLRGIETDDESRRDWLEMRAEGIKMLGLKVTQPQSVDAATGDGTLSSIYHPLLLEAVARFQANAGAELYPTAGPVKVRDDRAVKPAGAAPPAPQIGHNGGPPLDQRTAIDVVAGQQASREELAEALEKGFNHNLTVVDRGYRADSIQMLFWVGFGGCAFKKVYDCPIKGRPVSRFVDAADIIVNNTVSDHRDASRVTHRIVMRPALVKRMQYLGVYRKAALGEPQFQPNAQEQAVATATGLAAAPNRQEDQPRTLYESYVELDVMGYEHTDKGKPTGIPYPWRVTIDKDSRELLELRRNWDPDDDTYAARQCLVKFGFLNGPGFYSLGLLHLLGNGDKALTAAWRMALDAAMLGNFPGFIYNESAVRNWTNQNRIPPGGGLGIKGIGTMPLDQVIKALPYKDIGAGMIGLIQHVEQRMDRVAGTAELPVGEGRQDAPVGTTLALIEQATKIIAAAHVNLHDAQAEEFQLLKERYRDNPTAFWRWFKKTMPAWEREMFLKALDDYELTPAADPNTPSHVIRLIKCQAVKTVAMLRPDLYDMRKVDAWIYKMIGVSDPDQFFAPPAPAQPDPTVVAMQMQMQQRREEAATKARIEILKAHLKLQESMADNEADLRARQIEAEQAAAERRARAEEVASESADRAADRDSDRELTVAKLAVELLKQHMTAQARRQSSLERAEGGEGPRRQF